MQEKWYDLELNDVQAKWLQLKYFKLEEEIGIDKQKWCYKKQLDKTNQQQKEFSPMGFYSYAISNNWSQDLWTVHFSYWALNDKNIRYAYIGSRISLEKGYKP